MLKVKQIRIFIVIIIKLKALNKIELSKGVQVILGSFFCCKGYDIYNEEIFEYWILLKIIIVKLVKKVYYYIKSISNKVIYCKPTD